MVDKARRIQPINMALYRMRFGPTIELYGIDLDSGKSFQVTIAQIDTPLSRDRQCCSSDEFAILTISITDPPTLDP
jgi:hypothetical protein